MSFCERVSRFLGLFGMIKLIFSIVALYFGAGIYPFIKKHPAWLSFFDAFVLVSIIGLTLFHLLPHSIEAAGMWALLAALIGFGMLSALHLIQPHHDHGHEKTHNAIVWFALVGFIIHTLMDGMALGMGLSDTANFADALGLGVLFHRLPVGIFFAMILMPSYGAKTTIAAMTALATSTLIGAGIAHFAMPHMGLMFLNLVQALIAGSLLHVVFHNISIEGEGHKKHGWAWAKGLGAVVGIAVLILIDTVMPAHAHAHGVDTLMTIAEQLLGMSPCWIAMTAIVALAYFLRRKNHHLGCEIAALLDPQPTPGLVDARFHGFNAAALIAATASLSLPMLLAWLIGNTLVAIYARHESKHFEFCNACQRYESDKRCTQTKSFGLWLATSWSQLFIFAVVLALTPTYFEPLLEDMTLPTWALALAVVITLATLVLAKRGLAYIVTVFLAAVGASCLELHEPKDLALLLVLAWGAGFLFDYHASYLLRTGLDDESSLKRLKRIQIVAPSIIIVCALAAGAGFAATHPVEVSQTIVVPDEVSEDQHALPSSNVIAHEHDEHAPEHDEHDEHAHEHDEHAHEHHHHHHHDIVFDHHDMLPQIVAQLISVLLFLLTGLVLMFRHGPRKLFEMAMGRHGHRHEHEHAHEHEHEDHSHCHEHECHECHEWHDHHEHHDHDLDEK